MTYQQQSQIKGPIHIRTALQDCLFLTIIVLLSFILYIQDLGFHLDDWNFLEVFSNSSDQSVLGLFQSVYIAQPWARMRPVQLFSLAWQYHLFGLYPLGYHLINATVISAAVLLFYMTLRELDKPRLLALCLPLVYALLPHYSTDRFWIAAFQATISMALYFLSYYSDLRALRARSAYFWIWKLSGILSLICSILAYEVTLPLFLFNISLVFYRAMKANGLVPDRQVIRANMVISLIINLLVLILVIGFKVLVATRMGTESGAIPHAVKLAKGVIASIIGGYEPRVVWWTLRHQPNWTILAIDVVIGLIIFGYLYHVVNRPEKKWPSQAQWTRLTALGLVIYGLSYTIFLTDDTLPGSGEANRIAIAAAGGLAVSFVGGWGCVTTLLPWDLIRKRIFCLLVALLCMCGFLVINTVASFWVTAYRREQEILTSLRHQFPILPAGRTLIIDGVCLRVGTVKVFKYAWDFSAALRVFYRDPSLQADLVSPRLRVEEDGLSSVIHDEIYYYFYYEKPLIYHVGYNMTYQLTDAETAREYFQNFNPDHRNKCP
jgi:hypothetical protein